MKFAGKKCLQQIEEVSTTLGIPADRVKEWIGNRNAKVRADGGGRLTQRKVSIPRGTNGYSLFAKTVKRGDMDGRTYFSKVSGLWNKSLTEEERKTYMSRAKDIRDDPYKGQPRDIIIFSQLKVINQACEVLESIGYNVCGMGLDRENQSAPSLFGTGEGLKFLDLDLQDRFRLFLTGNITFQHAQEPNKENEQKELRQSVRKHFNTSWRNSTNLKGGLPYKEILTGKAKVEVQGLPDGVLFKDPSSYGTSTLKSILESRIVFKISNKEDAASGNATHEDEGGSPVNPVIEVTKAAPEQTSTSQSIVKGIKKRKQKDQISDGVDIYAREEKKRKEETMSLVTDEESELILKSIQMDPSSLAVVHDLEEEHDVDEIPVVPTDIAEDLAASLGVIGTSNDSQDKSVISLTDIKKDKTGMFNVQEIIDRKKSGQGYMYRVHWEGYPVEEATWEPRTHIKGLAKAYDKKMKTKI